MWVDKGDHYFEKISGELTRCPICRKPKEFSKPHKKCCHKCPPKVLAAIEGANKRLEEPVMQKKPYWKRLADGFREMRKSGDME